MTDNPYLQWPVFRRSVVAAFGRSLTRSAATPPRADVEEQTETDDGSTVHWAAFSSNEWSEETRQVISVAR
jgi:hypothetical protein